MRYKGSIAVKNDIGIDNLVLLDLVRACQNWLCFRHVLIDSTDDCFGRTNESQLILCVGLSNGGSIMIHVSLKNAIDMSKNRISICLPGVFCLCLKPHRACNSDEKQ